MHGIHQYHRASQQSTVSIPTAKMATVLFFEEDEVAMYSEATGYRCGIVTESSEYFSSDEDDESEYETYERLRKGTVRVAWHPDGKSQVLKESEV